MVGFNVDSVLRAPSQHKMEIRDVDYTPEESYNANYHNPSFATQGVGT